MVENFMMILVERVKIGIFCGSREGWLRIRVKADVRIDIISRVRGQQSRIWLPMRVRCGRPLMLLLQLMRKAYS